MDIRKIIKKLQDIDKLKMVLLNENQRKLFECIPKPDISKGRPNQSLHIDSILKFQKPKFKKITQNLPHNFFCLSQENSPVNKRILEILSPNLKKDLESIHNEKNSSFYFSF